MIENLKITIKKLHTEQIVSAKERESLAEKQ